MPRKTASTPSSAKLSKRKPRGIRKTTLAHPEHALKKPEYQGEPVLGRHVALPNKPRSRISIVENDTPLISTSSLNPRNSGVSGVLNPNAVDSTMATISHRGQKVTLDRVYKHGTSRDTSKVKL